MNKIMRFCPRFGLVGLGAGLMLLAGCGSIENFGVRITAYNASLEATDRMGVLDTLLVGFEGLSSRSQYQIQILRPDGTALFQAVNPDTGRTEPMPMILTTDEQGRIPPSALWYDVAVPTAGAEAGIPPGQVEVSAYRIVISGEGVEIELPFFLILDTNQPQVWAANVDGTVENSFLAGDPVYVTGRFFPPNTPVHVYVTVDRNLWVRGTTSTSDLTEVAGPVTLTTDGQGELAGQIWTAAVTSTLAGDVREYDVWVDINGNGVYDQADTRNEPVDSTLVSGFVVQLPPSAQAVVQQLASTGNQVSPDAPNYFGYSDIFNSDGSGTLWDCGVYLYFNALIQYGNLAADQMVRVFVLSQSDWEAVLVNPSQVSMELVDASGGYEDLWVQNACTNGAALYLIWPAPLTPGNYVIVIDINQDNHYDVGVDIVDGVNGTSAGESVIGLTVQ